MPDAIAELDRWYPPCGPCAFCGFHDKRHRLWDVWIAEADAGITAEDIADDFDQPIKYVEAVLRIRPYQPLSFGQRVAARLRRFAVRVTGGNQCLTAQN